MGSQSFQAISRATDPARGYEDLVAEALSVYGSDSYNGSISTTNGIRVFSSTPVLATVADRVEQRRLGELAKWGPCEAIAVGLPAKSKSITRTVDVHPFLGDAEFLEASHVAAALSVDPDLLASYDLLESRPKFSFTTTGTPTKRAVWSVNGRGEYASRSEAVKAAKASVLAEIERAHQYPHPYLPVHPCIVSQRIVTEDPVTVTPVRTSWRVKVRAEISAGEIVFDHWRFYGWAAI